jgi:biopolymer transport protein ExbD
VKFGARKRSEDQALDISPLIDVVFILLIFFMVTTTFQQDMQLELERPGSSSGARATTKALRVYIDRAGTVYVDDAPVKLWVLQSRVREYLRDSVGGTVLVVADRTTMTEKLIEVIDQCRLGGAVDVGVVTDAEG